MKTKAYLTIAIVLALGLAGSNVCSAQTSAAGHVTAEVIESASASSEAALTFSVGASPAGITSANTQMVTISRTPNPGTMAVSPGNNATMGVVVKPEKPADLRGNVIAPDSGVNNNSQISVNQSAGFRDIKLNGTANLVGGQPSGLNTGSYTVVFVYN